MQDICSAILWCYLVIYSSLMKLLIFKQLKKKFAFTIESMRLKYY